MQTVSLTALTGLLFLGIANAQPAATPLAFEAASVKPSPPRDPGVPMRVGMRGGPGSNDPGRLTIENFSLQNLIMAAYAVNSYQFSATGLSNFETFNISATIPEGTTREQFRLMFQNMMAERFKLQVHREMKEIPVFELVVAKGGPKMTPSPKDPVRADTAPPSSGAPGPPSLGSDGYPVLGGQGNGTVMMNGRARMRVINESMEKFAGMLSGQFGRPVQDKTGLEGEYDFSLYWNNQGGGPPAASAELDPGPTLMQAIQDQLGLKVQQTKGQVEMLVVDHVEKTPTEN